MVTVVDNRKKNKQTNFGSLAIGCMFFTNDEDEGLFLKVAEPDKQTYAAFSFLNNNLCYFCAGDIVMIANCTLVVEE